VNASRTRPTHQIASVAILELGSPHVTSGTSHAAERRGRQRVQILIELLGVAAKRPEVVVECREGRTSIKDATVINAATRAERARCVASNQTPSGQRRNLAPHARPRARPALPDASRYLHTSMAIAIGGQRAEGYEFSPSSIAFALGVRLVLGGPRQAATATANILTMVATDMAVTSTTGERLPRC
jgi:hypothetical protein